MTKRKENPQKRGRKSQYNPDFAVQAYKFSLLGLTQKRMAELFGVSEKTLIDWAKKKPEFRNSISKGQELADSEVANALVERATGYEYYEQVPTKIKEVIYENGKRVREFERVEVTSVKRVIPPDSQAMKYWMNNRRRNPTRKPNEEPQDAVWAERQEIDHTTGGDKLPAAQVYLPADLTPDEMGINLEPKVEQT